MKIDWQDPQWAEKAATWFYRGSMPLLMEEVAALLLDVVAQRDAHNGADSANLRGTYAVDGERFEQLQHFARLEAGEAGAAKVRVAELEQERQAMLSGFRAIVACLDGVQSDHAGWAAREIAVARLAMSEHQARAARPGGEEGGGSGEGDGNTANASVGGLVAVPGAGSIPAPASSASPPSSPSDPLAGLEALAQEWWNQGKEFAPALDAELSRLRPAVEALREALAQTVKEIEVLRRRRSAAEALCKAMEEVVAAARIFAPPDLKCMVLTDQDEHCFEPLPCPRHKPNPQARLCIALARLDAAGAAKEGR